jgi:hypothetical protein
MATPEEIRAFVQQYGPLAAQQAQRLNTTPQNILSQWALETGYGKSIIPGSNNLGNIKGQGVSARDNMLGTTDSYQAYDSPAAGAAGYGDLLNRRYPGVEGTRTPQAFGQALQKGGYAEDPDYVKKIGGVSDTLQRYASNVLGALTGSTSAQAGELTPAQRAYASAASGPTPPPVAKQQQSASAKQQQGNAGGGANDPWAALEKKYAQPDAQAAADDGDPWAALQKKYTVDPGDSSASATPAAQMDAGGPAAPATMPAPQPKKAAAPAAATPAAAPEQRGFLGDLAHQAGLTARMGITGVSSLPAAVGDLLNSGVNAVTGGINKVAGTDIPRLQAVSSSVQDLQDRAGVAKPENASERVVQDVGSAIVGAATGNAAGKGLQALAAVPEYATAANQAAPGLLGRLAQRSAPAIGTVGDFLAAQPGTQIASAAGGAAGSSGAREAGWGTGAQLGAGLLGSIAGAGTAGGLNRMITNRQDAQQAARLAANPDYQQQQLESAVQRATTGTPDLPPTARRALTADNMGADDAARLTQSALDNPSVDSTQLQRAQDFRALGMEPTTGQLSRDPGQYAKEQNLRGAQTKLANRFNQQDRQLANALDDLSPTTAADTYQAGSGAKTALKNIDDQMRQQVTDAYTAARESSGAKLDVPTKGLAQDYARVLDEFGDAVPSGVRNQFEKLGLMDGTQRKIFDMEDANQLTQVINKNVGNDKTANTALGELRKAVNDAVQSADDRGGVFAPAKQAAAQRFQLHDAIPALKDAATDATSADKFIQKYVIGGNTDEVRGMADLLRQHSPDQFNQVRAQVVQKLQDAAYGAGEEFRPGNYAKQLDTFGPQKLAAFFNPDEVEQLKTIGRVGSYMRTKPSASPVNYANTFTSLAAAAADNGLLSKIPWVGKAAGAVADRSFANQALAGGFQQMTPAALGGPNSAPGLLGLLGAGAANRATNR